MLHLLMQSTKLSQEIWYFTTAHLISLNRLRDILKQILKSAEEKKVELVGISMSSSLSWGNEISLPFMKHTSFVGSQLRPNVPWYLSHHDKNVDCGLGTWYGETLVARFDGQSTRAFRVDVPSYISDSISAVMGKLATYSCSTECLGYPHALFRRIWTSG
jgi:hypothetical protein